MLIFLTRLPGILKLAFVSPFGQRGSAATPILRLKFNKYAN